MNCFIHSGTSTSKRLTPKNVPKTAPNTVVAAPSVITKFMIPFKDGESLCFRKNPKAISTNP